MEDENEEIDVIEVAMSDSEIDEVIAQLEELKEHKTNVQFPIAADVDLLVHYDFNLENNDFDEDEFDEDEDELGDGR